VENNAAFQEALKEVAKIQQPVLNKISASIKVTLKCEVSEGCSCEEGLREWV